MYYRVHNEPEAFRPENAKSEPLPDADIECPVCHGDGYIVVQDWEESHEEDCEYCSCTGRVDYSRAIQDHPEILEYYRRPGYSCWDSPEKLVEYIRYMGLDREFRPRLVAVFEGEEVGEGLDGEPLVIPDMDTVRWIPWGEFVRRYERRAA